MKRIDTIQIQKYEIAHTQQLLNLAAECMVLLKQNGDFPIAKPGKVAVYGSGARQTIKGGTGSGDVNVRQFVNIEDGLEKAGFTVTTKAWLDAYDQEKERANVEFVENIRKKAKEKGVPGFFVGMGAVMPEPEYDLPLDGDGEVAIYVLARVSGEGSDRKQIAGDFLLTKTEKRDILRLAQKHQKFLLVLNVGGVVDLSPVMTVPNILLLSQLGSVTGEVFSDVILGKRYPSGKLASTWAPADDYAQIGDFGNADDTRYKEGIYVGYRYFDTVGKKPLFPFGFGLGFTEFNVCCTNFCVEDKQICVSVSVKNIGNQAGKEIIQLYYSAPVGAIDKPYQELGAFAKTKELQSGEAEELTLLLPVEDMASYSEEKAAWILEKGAYYLWIGMNSKDTVTCGAILLDQDVITEKLQHVGGTVDFEDWIPDHMMERDILSEDILVISINSAQLEGIGHHTRNSKTSYMSNENEAMALDFTTEDMVNACIGKFNEAAGIESIIGNSASMVAGAAGETSDELKEKGFGKLVMADGPAGLRISTEYVMSEEGAIAKGLGNMEMYLDFFEDNLRQAIQAKLTAESKEHTDKKTYYQYCSAIPIGTALAQSWNTELCRKCGELVGEEMNIFGIQLWLAPALNIHRSPLCGRNFEYYSEDPLLSGKMAAAITDGVQNRLGCGVTIKHFACNNQETNRFHSNSIVSERALREIYLKGFEIAVKEAQPLALMTSYNLLNGVHTCNRKDLITDVLRKEWGYEGIVMTDWLVTGGGFFPNTKYPSASAAGCIYAGNDLIMPGSVKDMKDIIESLDNEEAKYPIHIENLAECVQRIIRIAKRLEDIGFVL